METPHFLSLHVGVQDRVGDRRQGGKVVRLVF